VQANQANPWLVQLMENSAEFCGIMQLAGHRDEKRIRRKKPPFLGSFFLLFKKQALESDSFRSFWRDYRMTNNKRKTIRRGERAISAAMIAGGFDPYALFKREMFDEYVFRGSASVLRDLLAHLIAFDSSLQLRKDQLVRRFEDSHEWIAESRQVILDITNLQNLLVTAPIACLEIFDVPIIKKACTHQNLAALTAIQAATLIGRIHLQLTVSSEIGRKLPCSC
jgi:Rhamnan synthesis protein F